MHFYFYYLKQYYLNNNSLPFPQVLPGPLPFPNYPISLSPKPNTNPVQHAPPSRKYNETPCQNTPPNSNNVKVHKKNCGVLFGYMLLNMSPILECFLF